MRRVLLVGGVLAAALLVLVAALAFRLARSVPPLGGAAEVPGLGATVEVHWDSLAIPRIIAGTDLDAFRALGYLHARDRLWQMDVLRRAAEGRLAEILGPAAVSSDRFLRALDIRQAAEASLALVSGESRALLDAYVDGVNAWISAPTRPLPPEYQILRIAPEPWTAVQSVEIGRIMAWDLVNAQVELSLARASAALGPDRARDLMPWYPDSGAVILPPGAGTWRGAGASGAGRTLRDRRAAASSFVPSARLAARDVPAVPPLAAAVLDAVALSRASNSWVIGPARTRSGRPILANDPHLEFRAPSLWYLAAIESPSYRVAGATIAGMPAVVLGHNARIAWGLTNIEADDVDYVIERFTADSTRVLAPGGWAAVTIVRDSIRVKGGPAVPFTLLRTPDGPVVADAPAATDSGGTWRALAMRWNAHTPSDEFDALLAVDRAGSWEAFLAAVRGFKAPEQNWVYADVDGNIGYTASGNIPVRRAGVGLLPTPGWTGEGTWERFLDFDELPRAFNPPEGFIVTANNRVIGPEYPYLLASNPAPPYRAARIRELLAPAHDLTADDVRHMQMDTLDVLARALRGVAADAAAAAGDTGMAAVLRAWDGTAGADRVEPTVFWAWFRALQRLTYEDESPGYQPTGPFTGWLLAGASRWFDDVRTAEREDLAVLAARAMSTALAEAGGRRWGAVHATRSSHALGSVAVLNRLLRLNLGPAPRAGSLHTVNVAGFGGRPPFTNTFGASFRQVVDLGDVAGAGMILTTGQSGNPLSGHYRDQAPLWASGRLHGLSAVRRAPDVAVLRLTPARR